MTEPVLTTERKPIHPAMAKHPLAFKSGIELLINLVEAGKIWAKVTKVQRHLLDELCRPVIRELLERGELRAEDMPTVPDGLRSSTLGSLSSGGLIDDHHRVTGKAVWAWYYAVKFKERDGE